MKEKKYIFIVEERESLLYQCDFKPHYQSPPMSWSALTTLLEPLMNPSLYGSKYYRVTIKNA